MCVRVGRAEVITAVVQNERLRFGAAFFLPCFNLEAKSKAWDSRPLISHPLMPINPALPLQHSYLPLHISTQAELLISAENLSPISTT